jgi:ketosteroid isomerase-like protein
MFAAVDRSDWDTLTRFYHPDVVYDRPGFDRLTGREEVIRFYRDVRSIQGVHSFDGFAIGPTSGACWGRFVGSTKAGEPVDVQFADCYSFRDGGIWRRKSFFFVPVV